MTNTTEQEMIVRMLTGNPVAERAARRFLELEELEEARRIKDPTLYSWPGAEWYDIPIQTQVLNQLVIDGLLVTGGSRGTFKSNSSTTYKLKNPDLIKECLLKMQETTEDIGEGEIPNDLFDFIIGHDDIKDLLWRSIKAPSPVHVFLVGPPASSKSMILSELARLPFSRFTNGGGTSKAGLADYLLEFRPRYLLIDELDKMAMADMSILLSLMESGTVARLKKRMREIEKLTTTVFAAANRDDHIWPELKSRFFTVRLKEYSEADFVQIARTILVTREKVQTDLADCIVSNLAKQTRDIREAIHFGRLCQSIEDVNRLMALQWPNAK